MRNAEIARIRPLAAANSDLPSKETQRSAAPGVSVAGFAQAPALLAPLDAELGRGFRVVAALLSMQARGISRTREPAARQAFDEARGRVLSVLRVQDCVAQYSHGQTVAFGPYLEATCDDLRTTLAAPGRPALTCASDDAQLPSVTAIWLGLIASELVLSAYTYAFPPSARAGRITVSFAQRPGAWQVAVEDNGTEMCSLGSRRGASLKVVRAMVDELGGMLEVASVLGINAVTATVPGR